MQFLKTAQLLIIFTTTFVLLKVLTGANVCGSLEPS